MREDKSFLNYHGKAQCYHVYEILQEVCADTFISCNAEQSPLIDRKFKALEDLELYAHRGPATGVLTAFSRYPQKDFLVIGCDYPLLSELEIRQFLAVIPAKSVAAAFYDERDQCYQPVLAWYSSEAGSLFMKSAGNKNYSLKKFLESVNAFKFFPHDTKSLLSVDTKEAREEVMYLTNNNRHTKTDVSTMAITRNQADRFIEAFDQLAVEEPLQIQLQYGTSGNEQQKNLAVTMRTPGNDEELAAGFLYTEGILNNTSQLTSIIAGASGDNTVLAILKRDCIPDLQHAERNFYVTSSCGVCGKSSIDAVRKEVKYSISNEPVHIHPSVLHGLPDALRKHQQLFQSTGGLHACALFHNNGTLISLREDVGRHNALDKLIGNAFLKEQLPLQHMILLLSGRACFELVQKAAIAGIRIIAAIGAPSSLAVQLADEAGITLIGFLKNDRFNIYTVPERVIEKADQS